MSTMEYSKRFRDVLELDGSPVGVSYHRVEDIQQLDGRKTVCQLIQKARRGGKFFVTKDNMSCPGGAHYLGLIERVPRHEDFLVELEKIFQSPESAKRFFEVSPKPPLGLSYSVSFAPLEETESADVVLFVCNPIQAMRIIGLYTYESGAGPKNHLFGAACQAAITSPMVTKELSVSFIDWTARKLGAYKPDEVIVGVPFSRLESMVDAIEKSTWGTAKPRYKVEDLLKFFR